MRYLRVLIASLGLCPMSAMASDEVASPEQFGSATSTCFKALEAKTPRDVLAAVEANGWKLRRPTTLGGIFSQTGSSIELKIETVLVSRICTVLGNRDQKVPLLETSQLIEANLKERLQDKLKRDETKTGYAHVAEEKYLAVIGAAINENRFNTQITTIDI